MADPRFFNNTGPYTAGILNDLVKGTLIGDPTTSYNDVAALDKAQAEHVSFLDNVKYAKSFEVSQAGLCIIHPDVQDNAPEGMNLIIHPEPYMAYALIARHFYPDAPCDSGRVHPKANIAATADVSDSACIDAGVVIGENCKIGAGTWVKANTVIEDGVSIGENCTIAANVTIAKALIGNNVVIHAGCQIGQDGFGFASGPQGHVRIPQLGRVIIEDGVNIGANSTIDRGAGPDTVIGTGTQIDNLVQIGHNVKIGRYCVIVSHVGISGSTKLGDFVVCGGQTGVAGHLSIGSGVRIAARSGVTKDIPNGITVAGFPAVAHKQWLKQQATLSKLSKSKK